MSIANPWFEFGSVQLHLLHRKSVVQVLCNLLDNFAIKPIKNAAEYSFRAEDMQPSFTLMDRRSSRTQG